MAIDTPSRHIQTLVQQKGYSGQRRFRVAATVSALMSLSSPTSAASLSPVMKRSRLSSAVEMRSGVAPSALRRRAPAAINASIAIFAGGGNGLLFSSLKESCSKARVLKCPSSFSVPGNRVSAPVFVNVQPPIPQDSIDSKGSINTPVTVHWRTSPVCRHAPVAGLVMKRACNCCKNLFNTRSPGDIATRHRVRYSVPCNLTRTPGLPPCARRIVSPQAAINPVIRHGPCETESDTVFSNTMGEQAPRYTGQPSPHRPEIRVIPRNNHQTYAAPAGQADPETSCTADTENDIQPALT